MRSLWLFFGVSWIFSPHVLFATEDSIADVILLEILQETNLTQLDSVAPLHVRSVLSMEMDHFFVYRDGDISPDSVEFELPTGATGVITEEEIMFTEDRYKSSYRYESAVDDFSERFPKGIHTVTIRGGDGACVGSRQFLREEFAGETEGQTWRNGKLHLPKEALVLRWEVMEPGLFVQFDTEGISQVRVSDAKTGEQIFSGTMAELANIEDDPFHWVGVQQGLNLSDQPDIVEGETYDVHLEQIQTTEVVDGNTLVETKLISRLSFKLFVDPDAPVPQMPRLDIATDDGAGTVSISWMPDPDTDYLVAADNRLFLDSIPGQPLALLITPESATSELSFTESISGDTRRFYRVFPIPK